MLPTQDIVTIRQYPCCMGRGGEKERKRETEREKDEGEGEREVAIFREKETGTE